jgi:hypothetical protein
MLNAMNLTALPISHMVTRRAVEGAHPGDRVRPAPRTRRR